MGRDLRQINSKNEYPDRCYFYDSISVEKNTLKPDAKPLGRFYKRDLVPFQWERITIGGTVTSRRQFVGTIQTLDYVENLRPDMFVKIDNALYRVDTPIVRTKTHATNRLSARPSIITDIRLIGVENKNG